jgi:ABC-type Fe3+ transport system permease subunit
VIFLQSANHKLISIEIYLNAAGGRFGLACVQSTYLILIVLLSQTIVNYIEKKWDFSSNVLTIPA